MPEVRIACWDGERRYEADEGDRSGVEKGLRIGDGDAKIDWDGPRPTGVLADGDINDDGVLQSRLKCDAVVAGVVACACVIRRVRSSFWLASCMLKFLRMRSGLSSSPSPIVSSASTPPAPGR